MAGTVKESSPLSKRGFYAFAPEIREIIFRQHFAGSWDGFDGQTPSLLQALRKSRLYMEAVDAFTQRKSFKLHEGNSWDLGKMAPVFSALEIVLPSSGMDYLFTHSISRIFRSEIIWKVKNIRCLIIQTNLVIPCTSSSHFRSPQVARAFDGIFTMMRLMMKLTELRVLNLAPPNDNHALRSPSPSDARSRSFEYCGNELVKLLSETLNQQAELKQE